MQVKNKLIFYSVFIDLKKFLKTHLYTLNAVTSFQHLITRSLVKIILIIYIAKQRYQLFCNMILLLLSF